MSGSSSKLTCRCEVIQCTHTRNQAFHIRRNNASRTHPYGWQMDSCAKRATLMRATTNEPYHGRLTFREVTSSGKTRKASKKETTARTLLSPKDIKFEFRELTSLPMLMSKQSGKINFVCRRHMKTLAQTLDVDVTRVSSFPSKTACLSLLVVGVGGSRSSGFPPCVHALSILQLSSLGASHQGCCVVSAVAEAAESLALHSAHGESGGAHGLGRGV
mmetsp:Transcript_8486/g.16548  ORF Transcript_8486/g.16548 Transcript_8486/m.16548 type:complete len:217 (+) Transcript_8486:115-765(+)